MGSASYLDELATRKDAGPLVDELRALHDVYKEHVDELSELCAEQCDLLNRQANLMIHEPGFDPKQTALATHLYGERIKELVGRLTRTISGFDLLGRRIHDASKKIHALDDV
ncbi:MAG: hypothetical protein HOI33_11335 [Rhodospirillaceae bacterium]|nr:hypothetical protein [Rhodospirillaceae bacterium]